MTDLLTRIATVLLCRALDIHRIRYFPTFAQCERCRAVLLP